MERDDSLTRVRDVMTKAPMALHRDTPLDEALTLLASHGWTGAPIVDEAGHLVGVFSEMDALFMLADASFHGLPPGTVGDHTSDPLVDVTPDTDVYAAIALLKQHHVRRLPVCEGPKLVGLVTAHDLGRAVLAIQQQRHAVHVNRPPRGASWDPESSKARDAKRH